MDSSVRDTLCNIRHTKSHQEASACGYTHEHDAVSLSIDAVHVSLSYRVGTYIWALQFRIPPRQRPYPLLQIQSSDKSAV